jgi:predicted extracellular nuclease/Ca2+-binding RTX toxin-like protein
MGNGRFVLSTGTFSQNWSLLSQISVNDDWSGVASIVGFLGDTNASAPTGVDPRTLTANDASAVDVIANLTNPNNTSGGVGEFEVADPTIALQGSGTADSPYLSIYLDATGRENVTFSCNLRDIDSSADNAAQQVVVQYRTSPTGTWTNVAYVADATTGPSLATLVTPINVVLPVGANNAPELEIRIMTTNAVGSDEWVGIDDIVVSSSPLASPTGILTINDVAIVEGNSGTTDITFTVTRSGSTVGAASASYTVAGVSATAADFAGGTIPVAGTVSFLDGQALQTITLSIAGDTIVEPNETFTVTLSAPTGATISDAIGIGTITNDDFAAVEIYTIQGAAHTSGFVGQTVTTNGIVTAVDTSGFYLQSATGDGNASTSDGIFILTTSAPGRAVGDAVTVTGVVQEFLPSANAANLTTTQISSVNVNLISTGNPLPAAVLIGTGGLLPPTDVFDDDGFTLFDPVNDAADFYESLEGMRVTIDAPIVTSATNSFNETLVVASGGAGSTGLNARGGMTISGNAVGPDDFNPERIQIDDDSGLFAGFVPNYTQGDILSSVTGVVSYNFQNYEVLVTEAVTITTDVAQVSREITTIAGTAERLTIAAYNVENLDPTDPKFGILADDIVNHLLAPDIISLEEIQDPDGAGTGTNLSGAVTAQLLIDAIIAAGGPTYSYIEIAPTTANSTGGEPNGNIRNGFLYNDARVDYVAGSAALVPGSAFTGSRSPLAAQFDFNGQVVTAIAVHSTSRGGSGPLFGAVQPIVIGGDAARTAQAAAIRLYVDGLLAVNPDAHISVLGDFNGFTFETAIETLTAGNVLVDANTLLPEAERYSYVFDGNAQALDHILLSGGLLSSAIFDAVHINSEQPATAARATDHDALLVSVRLLAPGLGWTTGDDVGFNDATSNDINGRTGFDRLDMSAITAAITIDLSAGTIQSAQTGNDTVRNIESFSLGSGDDIVTGSDADTTINGNGGNDTISGGLGRDLIGGGDGNDILSGGSGAANELVGGSGDDIFIVEAIGETIVELAGGGFDQVNTARASFVLADNVEALSYTGASQFVGIGNGGDNVISGGILRDTLAGGAGADTLRGGSGAANELIGGDGNDVYVIGAIGDTIVEAALGGIDRVETDLAVFNLQLNVENLVYTGGASFAGVGNDGANDIQGGLMLDTLSGGNGDDILRGGQGDANELIGGNGDDIYVIQAAGDSTIEDFGAGIDTIQTDQTSHVLAANIENLTFLAANASVGIGNDLSNIIIGNGANDFLAGLAGDDVLTGGGGADIFRFSEAGADIITDFTSGTDIIYVDGAVFIPNGTLSLVQGSGAQVAPDENSAFLYDDLTGMLSFDADGNGAGAAVAFANIGAGTLIALGDLILY